MEQNPLTERLRFVTLVLGVVQVITGCVAGLLPPDAVAWYRGLVMAHIQFTANGVLLIVLGLLLRDMRLTPAQFRIWFISTQAGTWLNGIAGLIAAFTGQSSSQMPNLNAIHPPPNGATSTAVYVTLMFCGLFILTGLGLTLIGLLQGRKGERVA